MMTNSRHNLLHQESNAVSYDPRLLLLLVIVSIALVFSAASWYRLLFLGCSVGLVLHRLKAYPLFWTRLFWLRWFILSTIILHMLFSPGHTLFGMSWMTYEGLIRGSMISTQIVIAMAISVVFSRALRAEDLVSGGCSLMKPLSILGIDVAGMARQVGITLDFVPILRQEGSRIATKMRSNTTGIMARIILLTHIVEPLMLSLIDRADEIAHAEAENSSAVAKLPTFWPLSRADSVLFLCSVMIIAFYWVLP